VTRFYAIDEANASLPEVERILVALRDQREELITRRYSIDEAPQAFADLQAGKNARGVIVF